MDLPSPVATPIVLKDRFTAILSDEELRECVIAKVFACSVEDPKLINPLFKYLGERFPMKSLAHLKRVKKVGNKSLIIIDLVESVEESSLTAFKDAWPNVNIVEVDVPRFEALTEVQRAQWSTVWPIASRIVELYDVHVV